MKHNYVIIDDNQNSILETRATAAGFQNLSYAGSATNYDEALNLILEQNPAIVFLEIDPMDPSSKLSLQLINELHRYLKIVPKIIITTKSREFAFDAIRYEVFDYQIKPVNTVDLRKAILRFEKSLEETQTFRQNQPEELLPAADEEITPELIVAAVASPDEKAVDVVVAEELVTIPPPTPDKPLIICVKSYGDYRFIEATDICYLQADNNSTDIHLKNGEMITAFKTLKHFETVLNAPFVRIHNSYIVNIDFVTRIHTGNAVCYIKNSTTAKLPFSKSYKENVDAILESISNGNYLEI